MTTEQFNEILADRLAKIESVLGSKAKEYASDTDRLHNFKEAALMRGETPTISLLGMLVKHWVSVQDMVRLGLNVRINPAMIDEKIGDAINYLVLLEALLKEQK